jgi:hypothetical protein
MPQIVEVKVFELRFFFAASKAFRKAVFLIGVPSG